MTVTVQSWLKRESGYPVCSGYVISRVSTLEFNGNALIQNLVATLLPCFSVTVTIKKWLKKKNLPEKHSHAFTLDTNFAKYFFGGGELTLYSQTHTKKKIVLPF